MLAALERYSYTLNSGLGDPAAQQSDLDQVPAGQQGEQGEELPSYEQSTPVVERRSTQGGGAEGEAGVGVGGAGEGERREEKRSRKPVGEGEGKE